MIATYRSPTTPECAIRTFTVSLIGAAALAAGLVLIRQQKQPVAETLSEVPPGESLPSSIVLERLRKAGI